MTNTQRVNIGKQHPAAYKTLIALSAEVKETAAAAGLDPLLVELLKIRVSHINGCAFCLRMTPATPSRRARTPTGSPSCPGGKRPATSPKPTEPPPFTATRLVRAGRATSPSRQRPEQRLRW
ncbi:carboxymuconolactone decarboxylase family protein [Saccharopolyspora shandongensis]|uniref:carboxymuconolactone decarboxylase family protein n=1 Tax=Saccharopolyspora shandongensis TaxID=418495 RepID=UPI001C430D58